MRAALSGRMAEPKPPAGRGGPHPRFPCPPPQQDVDARAHGGLGELHFPDVLLGEAHRIREGQRVVRNTCAERGGVGFEASGFVHDPGVKQQGQRIQYPGAAQPARRRVADGGKDRPRSGSGETVSMAPSCPAMPQERVAPSKHGPAAAEQA